MNYNVLNFKKIGHLIIIDLIGPMKDPQKVIQLSYELKDICNEIQWDEDIRVVILKGDGENPFSIGSDLIENLLGENEEENHFFSLTNHISKLDKPIISAIDGDAIDLGLELIMACDIRISSDRSHFGLTHIQNGFIPWDGGTQRLSRLVGKAYALEMIFTGMLIDAKESLRIGLINRVIPHGELINFTMDMAKGIAKKAPVALIYAKESILKGMDLTLEQGIKLEADLYFLLHTTRDRSEGIMAFREKREPLFEGR